MAETASYPFPRHSKGPSKPYSGNVPWLDEDLYTIATIIKIEEKVFHEGTKKEWKCYRWLLESHGSLRPWQWSELTVKHTRPPDRKGEINALAQWLICLGLRTTESLKAEDISLEQLKPALGRHVRFQTHRKDGYYRVIMATLSEFKPGKVQGKA
jgi:hypothetical protein